MDPNAVIEGYLAKKSYQRNDARVESIDEMALRLRAGAEVAVTNVFADYNPDEGPSSYAESYAHLKKWVHGSLDLYRDELMSLLFPVFVHSYLDLVAKGFTDEAKAFLAAHVRDHNETNAAEIIQLSAVTHPQHVMQNKLASMYRKNKVNIKLSAYGFELLIRFLQESKLMLLLALVNEFLCIEIREAKTGVAAAAGDAGAGAQAGSLVGLSQAQLDSMVSKHKVLWGAFPPLDAAEALLEPVPKKRAVASAQGKPVSQPVPDLDRVPLPPVPELAELQSFQEVRERLAVSAEALPSVCIYTWLNTHDQLSSLSFSANGALMAAGFEDSTLTVCDLEGHGFAAYNAELPPVPASRLRFVGHSSSVFATSIAPDGRYVLSGAADGVVRLWSLETRSCLVSYTAHTFPIWDVDASPLGAYFATASHDTTARIFATSHPTALRVCVGHLSDVDCVRFHPNGNYVATGSSDRTARLWDVQTGECVRVFVGHKGGVGALAFSPDGRYLATGSDDSTVTMWDIGSGEAVQTFASHRAPVYSLAFSHDSNIIASGGADKTVRLFDAAAEPSRHGGPKQALRVLYTKATPVMALRFTPVNILLAGGRFTMGHS
eukprot:Amastigsp_a174552_42.p1 type:complete len:605 gc:universal Amastigsp_a174552_42:1836-22(-)